MLEKFFKKVNSILILKISAAIFSSGILASLVLFLAIFFADKTYLNSFCLNKSCISYFHEIYSPSFNLLIFFSTFSAGFVAIFSALAAINNYELSVKNNALSNHISLLDLFQRYVNDEVQKYPRIEKNSIDTLKLFTVIFPNSRSGDQNPSNKYFEIHNNLIYEINLLKETLKESAVIYPINKYQNKIKGLLATLGVKISIKPNKTDYFNMETDVFNLLNRINECFCSGAQKNLEPLKNDVT